MFVGATRLSDILYVPETFSRERTAEIAARRAAKFASVFGAQAQTQRRMLLVGELKRLTQVDNTVAVIKHAPDMPFRCDGWPCIDGTGDRSWPADRPRPVQHLMVIATFTWSSETGARVRHLEVLTMSDRWLPILPSHSSSFTQLKSAQKPS